MPILNKHFQEKDNIAFSLPEEIERIYFKAKDKKGEKKSKPTPNRLWILWIIVSLILFLAIFLFIFFNNIDVQVEISRRNPQSQSAFGRDICFLEGGKANKNIVEKSLFQGDARPFSRVRNDKLVLVNSRGYGWSNYTIEIERPVNLDKHNITYTAKGQTGNEYLTLAIVDVNNTSYRMEKDLSGALTKEWKKYSIDFKSVKDAPLDIENVSVIKFEFGTLTVGNTQSATIFLKDIYLTKK